MLNGTAALGILAGGSTGGMPAMSALNLFRQINRNEGKLREQYFNREDVQKSIEGFKNKVANFEDVDALVKDRKSLQFLLSAFDLDSELNNAGKIKAILKSDPGDPNSFANRLNDKRFGELAEFVNVKEKGLTNLRTASRQQTLIDKFLQNTFEKDVGGQNPEIAKAFYFLRNINSASSNADLLGTLQLRQIVTTALRLPPEIARQSIDKQISLVKSKFDLSRAKKTTSGTEISDFRQTRFSDDIQAIERAQSQVTGSETTLNGLEKRLKRLRENLDGLPSITDPTGINSVRIPIHETAVKQLSEINGATAAANAAVSGLDPIMEALDSRALSIREVETQDELDDLKESFAAEAAKVSDLIYQTARFRDPDTGAHINLFKPGGGAVDTGQPNAYTAKRINYAYQEGTLGTNPITTMSGGLGTNPYTVQSGTLGTNPYTVQSGTLGSNPYTVQTSTLGSNPFTVQSGVLGSNPFEVAGGDLDENPFKTIGSSNSKIFIALSNNDLKVGDMVTISGAEDFMGVDVNGTHEVVRKFGNGFRIDTETVISDPDHPTFGGGSNVSVTSNRIEVTQTGHPFEVGDTVTFSGASAVGGLDLNGTYEITHAASNNYKFLASSIASSAGTGGGSSVTVNVSDQVTVAHTGHPFNNGDTVTFSGSSSVGGLDLNGSFTVANKTDNTYTITASSTAVPGTTGGGSSVTVNASDQVTVAHTGHPFNNGDTVTFSGGSSVGGVSLNGNYTVANKTDNSYTITAGSQGISGNGGGSSVTVNASNKFTVAHTGHPFSNGETVIFSGGSSVDGVSLNGSFLVTGSTANSYTVEGGSQATAGETGGGSSVTVNASNKFTVAHTGHPFSNGETVIFSGGSSVDGVSLNGRFTVTGSTANSYTVEGGSQATAGETGGGGSITVNASNQVTVAQTDHLFEAGDYVTLNNVSSVGGLTLNGTFQVASASDNSYVITVGSQAIADQTGGGSGAGYGHTLEPNPFTTTNGSALVSVAHGNHDLAVGDVVYFNNSSAVGGLDLNTTFRVTSVTDDDNYVITATSSATSSVAGGGGTAVGFTAPELISVVDELNSNVIAHHKDMATFVSKIASAATTIANATLSNAVINANSAITDLKDANTEFDGAKGVLNANHSTFAKETGKNSFAARLNSTEIAKGRASILDAISRAKKIETSMKTIDTLVTKSFSSDNATEYAEIRADIASLLNTPGDVLGNTSGALANNPFQTQSGNAQVSVTHANHGFAAGDSVTFASGSSVGGLDLNATFTVTSVADANTYVITASGNASSTASGGGGSVSFTGVPKVTLDNLLAVSTNTNYRIREGVNEFIAANPGLDDIDGSGPYALSDSTRLNSLVPAALTSGNQSSVQSSSVTFLNNVKTVRYKLERDLSVFNFVANVADPLGAIDAEMRNINENIDGLFDAGKASGVNLIDPSTPDLSIQLTSNGKKLTVEAQNTLKNTLKGYLENYSYSVLKGGRTGALGANPFTTANGSATVTVAHTAHGFSVNDFVKFSDGSDVGGLNLDTTFQIANIVDENSYTITASSAATSTAKGGGGGVSFETIPTDRNKFMINSHFDTNRAYGKIRAERIGLNVESAILRAQFEKPIEVESEFLKPLENTDYAIKFIEKYLLIQDLKTTGVSFVPTNNNALALNLIKSIRPSRGIGLNVNMFS